MAGSRLAAAIFALAALQGRAGASEVLRFTIFWPERPPLVAAVPWLAQVLIEAREDGSELVDVEGWGQVELWPSEPHVRRLYRANASRQAPSLSWVWIAGAAEGAFDVFVTHVGR